MLATFMCVYVHVWPLDGCRQSVSHRQPENKSRNLLMVTLTMNNNRIYHKYIGGKAQIHIDRIENW